MSRQKEISIGKLIVKDGEYVYEVTQWLMVYDEILNKWNKTNKRVIYKTVPEHDGCTKSLTFQAIIKKPMRNTYEDNPPSAFFLAKYICKVPEEKKYKNYWLKKVWAKTVGLKIVCSVMPTHAFILSLTDEFFEQIGKESRISVKKAKAMLDAKEAVLVEKHGDTYQFCAYDARL